VYTKKPAPASVSRAFAGFEFVQQDRDEIHQHFKYVALNDYCRKTNVHWLI
jgi:hypothetical protein